MRAMLDASTRCESRCDAMTDASRSSVFFLARMDADRETRVDADEGALGKKPAEARDRVAIQGEKVCRCREAGAGGAVLRRW